MEKNSCAQLSWSLFTLFLIGLTSGLWLEHAILFLMPFHFVGLDLCFELLSYWKVIFSLSSAFQQRPAGYFFAKLDWYLELSMIRSILTRGLVWRDTGHSMILPPPCFTMGALGDMWSHFVELCPIFQANHTETTDLYSGLFRITSLMTDAW